MKEAGHKRISTQQMSVHAQFIKGEKSGQSEGLRREKEGWEEGFGALMYAITVYMLVFVFNL